MGVSKLKFGGVLVNSVTTNSLTTHKVRINGNLVWDDSVSTHTVTFSCQHGTVIATVDGVEIQSGAQVEHGKSVVFTIYPSAHYHYHYTNPETVLVDADVTRNYVCDIDVFFVDFSCTNGSVGATVDGIGIQSGGFVDYGKTVVFTITPNEGYEYTGENPESVVVHDNVEKNYECTPVSTWTGLKFVSASTSTMKWVTNSSTFTKDIQYSIDQGANWVSLTSTTSSSATAISFTEMWVKGTNSTYATSTTKYNYFVFGGSNVAVSGNIMSLINATSFESLTTLSATYTFYKLFTGQSRITSCPTLPATTLKANCYDSMFYGCTNIVDGPVLPASTLVSSCYKSMFYNCTKLTSLTCLATSGVNTTNLSSWTYGIGTTGVFTWNGTTWPGFTKNNNAWFQYNGVPANWSLNPPYYVTLNASATNGSVAATVGGSPVQLPYQALWASSAVLTVTPDSGYGFSQWSDGNTANPRTLTMTQAYNLTATCATAHTVTFSCQHGSVVAKVGTTVIQSGDQVVEGKTVTFTITPDSGYEYTGTNPESVVVSGDVTKNYVCTPSTTWTGLKFTANTAGSTISFNQEGIWSGTWPIEVSTDGSTWSEYTLGTAITLTNVGDYVWFRGQKDSTSQAYNAYRKFVMTGSIAASGDITSLLNGVGGVTNLTSYGIYTFCRMFQYCTSLTSAPSLSSTTLASSCYYYMFRGCTSLISAPSLPATTLIYGCYQSMFHDCTSLTTVPSLPATTLAWYCYHGMFQGCTSLTSAPTLQATTLENWCYCVMFSGCTSLTTAPSLPATTLVSCCYLSMFEGCTSLTGPVNISATSPYSSGTTSACSGMFGNSGTSRPSTPTDYNKIKVGGNVSAWNATNAGIDSTYWTVELITEGDIEEQ